MKRRQVLKVGLMFGVTVIGEKVAGVPPAEAKKPGAGGKFFVGSMATTDDPPPDNRVLRIGIAGTRAQGYAIDPDAPGDRTRILVMAGSFLHNQLTLTLFNIDDRAQTTPLGTLTGQLRGSILAGTVSMSDARPRSFRTELVKPDKKSLKQLAGTYDGDTDELINKFKAKAVVRSNGTFQISDIRRADGTAVPGELGGVFVATPIPTPGFTSNNIYAMLLPTRSASGVHISGEGIANCACCDANTPEEKEQKKAMDQAALGMHGKSFGSGGSVDVQSVNDDPTVRYIQVHGTLPPRR